MKRETLYVCKFEENILINEKANDYKKYCDFENRPNNDKPYKKFYDNRMFRYSLKCKIQDKGESITVILMNPSLADEYGLDSTLKNVKDFLREQKIFSEFEVLNIFPIRTPNSGNVAKSMKKCSNIQKMNDEYIKTTLLKSKNVLVAWGSKYHNQAKWVLKFLRDNDKDKDCVFVYSVNKDGSPKHFAPQAYNRVKKNAENINKKLKLQKY